MIVMIVLILEEVFSDGGSPQGGIAPLSKVEHCVANHDIDSTYLHKVFYY